MRLKVVKGSEPIVPQIILRALATDGTLIANWRVVLVAPPRILYTESDIWTGVKAAVTSETAIGLFASTTGNRKSLIAPITDIVNEPTYTIWISTLVSDIVA